MGSDDERFPDEQPRHLVEFSTIFGSTPHLVTNLDFKRFLEMTTRISIGARWQ